MNLNRALRSAPPQLHLLKAFMLASALSSPAGLFAQVAIQSSGTQTIVGNGNTIDGGGKGGFFVQGGTLNISNTTLTNFQSVGGNGSGGGGGLGGAVFVNTGSTLTLRNVNFVSDTAQGGNGGVGTIGGSLNNRFNSGTPTISGNGTTPHEVVPGNWTGRIVNPKSAQRSLCQRNDVSTVPI